MIPNLKHRAAAYLESPDLPRGWQPIARTLLRYEFVKLWAELEAPGCTEMQLETVLRAILKTAFDCLHNDPRNAMRRYAEAGQRIHQQAFDLWRALEEFRDLRIEGFSYRDQVNLDGTWNYLIPLDFGAADRVLEDLMEYGAGVQYLAGREIPRREKSIYRRFCEKLEEKFRWHRHVSGGFWIDFSLTHEALAELIAALFDVNLTADTIKKNYNLTPRRSKKVVAEPRK